jgi:hypothetical protein
MLLCYPIKRAEYSFRPAGLMQIKQFIHRKEHTLPLRFLYSMQSTHRETKRAMACRLRKYQKQYGRVCYQLIVAGRVGGVGCAWIYLFWEKGDRKEGVSHAQLSDIGENLSSS